MFPKSSPRTAGRMRIGALDAALVRVQESAIRDTLRDAQRFLERHAPHLVDRFKADFAESLTEDPTEK